MSRIVRIVVFLVLWPSALAVPAAATPLYGVWASGEETHCLSGPPYTGCLAFFADSSEAGGPGATIAQAQHDSLPDSAYLAFAGTLGPHYLPFLYALAEAAPTLSSASTDPLLYDFSGAYANARGIQKFDYHGTTTASFDLKLHLTASLLGTLATAQANLAVFDAATYDPDAEVNVPLDFDTLSGSGASVPPGVINIVALDETVHFTLDPGQSIYVVADLSVGAATGANINAGRVLADARHTFTSEFTSGPVEFLVPSLTTPVGEAASLAMAGIGLAGIGVAAGRRRQRPADSRHSSNP
jgi:hypothetical protein